MNIRGTDFVMYPVTDLERAATFYRDVLGLRQESYNSEWKWAEFDCGNVTLAIKSGETLPQAPAGARIALAVEDVRAAHKEMRMRGVRIAMEPQDFSVCWAMEILDPDGNGIMLHQRADGSVGPDGWTRKP